MTASPFNSAHSFPLGAYFLELSGVSRGDSIVRHWDPCHGLGWLHYSIPDRVLVASTSGEVQELLRTVQTSVDQGLTAVGFLSYEALGPSALEEHLPTPAGIFSMYATPPKFFRELAPLYQHPRLELDRSDLARDQFGRAFRRVKQALANGDCYQVNLTFPIEFRLEANGLDLFASRCGVDPAAHATYLCGEEWEIVSFSPELFFEKFGEDVRVRPMKGTSAASSGLNVAKKFLSGQKSRAENLMIVDMMRHDLGKISRIGSVSAPELFTIEKHRSVYQLTSTVESKTELSASQVVGQLMPAASVTGAPKVAACKLIRELETTARGCYCGAIGSISPGGWAKFSVGIRTAWVSEGRGRFGVGAGIVWDSDEEEEYHECLLKSEVLRCPAAQWELRESLGKTSDLGFHLQRLNQSAKHLGIETSTDGVMMHASDLQRELGSGQKVVIGLARDGSASARVESATFRDGKIIARLASHPVSSKSLVHPHKTNARQEYWAFGGPLEIGDLLMYNEANLLTEFTTGAVLLRLNGNLKTPRLGVGRLDSITVRTLVAEGKAEYQDLTLSDLTQAEAVYLANSVVGLREVRLVDQDLNEEASSSHSRL